MADGQGDWSVMPACGGGLTILTGSLQWVQSSRGPPGGSDAVDETVTDPCANLS